MSRNCGSTEQCLTVAAVLVVDMVDRLHLLMGPNTAGTMGKAGYLSAFRLLFERIELRTCLGIWL